MIDFQMTGNHVRLMLGISDLAITDKSVKWQVHGPLVTFRHRQLVSSLVVWLSGWELLIILNDDSGQLDNPLITEPILSRGSSGRNGVWGYITIGQHSNLYTILTFSRFWKIWRTLSKLYLIKAFCELIITTYLYAVVLPCLLFSRPLPINPSAEWTKQAEASERSP